MNNHDGLNEYRSLDFSNPLNQCEESLPTVEDMIHLLVNYFVLRDSLSELDEYHIKELQSVSGG